MPQTIEEKKAKPRITGEEIQRYLDLEAERLDLQRQARDKERLAAELKTKMEAWVRDSGKGTRTHSAGFVLAIKTKAGTVSWADEFVRIAGEAEAQRLRAEAPPKEYLTVEPTK